MTELLPVDRDAPPPPAPSDAWPAQGSSRWAPLVKRFGRRVLVRALACVVAATIATVVLEWSTIGGWEWRWWSDQLVTFTSFYVDALIVWLFLLLLWSLLGRLTRAVAVLWCLTVLVAVANSTKLALRSEPLYPSDVAFVGEAGFLLPMLSATTVVGVVLGCSALLGGAWWLERRRRRASSGSPQVLVARGLTLLVTACLLWQTTNFNDPGNPWRSLYELRGDHWRMSNQATNYRSNGFVGGFLYNMPVAPMAEPPGYGPAAIAAIVDEQRLAAAAINADRTGSFEDVNVILVLSESFTDPMAMSGFELDHDPIPHVREVMEQTLSGDMVSPMYGAGTANVEFEIMTGQSLALFRPQVHSPYQNFVADSGDYPSVVDWFNANGHHTVAIHPFGAQMYKRNEVYPALGFDEFIDADHLAQADRIDDSPYISDTSALHEVVTQIDESDEPVFVNLVTMQNHIPFGDHYTDPVGVTGVDEDQAERLGQYARGLEHSDAAVANFLDDLTASGEKSVVVYYGDHHPGIYDAEVKRANGGLGMHRVPFFIWRSWGNEHRPLPLTAPTSFLPLLFEAADAPVPPYVALLEQERREIGILRRTDGVDIPGMGGDAAAGDAVTDLREELTMVQYDLSIGQRLGADDLWATPAP